MASEMNNKISKKEFLKLYEEAKIGKVDLLQLPPQTLEMMRSLVKEEIKIKKQKITMLKAKLN